MKMAEQNLLNGKNIEDSILITGNTVIDDLLQSIDKVIKGPSDVICGLCKKLGSKEMILVIGHFRENQREGFVRIFEALKSIAMDNEQKMIVSLVPLNPIVQEPLNRILSGKPNVLLIKPMVYVDFIWMMNRPKNVITNSGSIEEEGPRLGKPVLVMGKVNSRPEAVALGTVILVGTNTGVMVVITVF